MQWFGLGKPRSKLGKFIDNYGINQSILADKSGVNKNTITKLCSEEVSVRNRKTGERILKAIRELTGKDVNYDDFWRM